MAEKFDKLAEKIGVVVQGGTVSIENVNIYPSPPPLPTGIPQNLPYSGAKQFVGRSEELDILHQQLQQTDRVAISAVSGMGGVGKTELALQYAVQHINDYSGGVCWLRAREANVNLQILEFAKLHLNLEIPEELGGEKLNLNQQIKWCWQHWQPSEGLTLLILDDVTDLISFRDLVQFVPNRFRVLVTTRKRQLDSSFAELYLDVLSPGSSVELLAVIISEERIRSEIKADQNLCQWLGYLPLGLELVGRYLVEDPELSLTEMLSRLKAQSLKNEALDLNERQIYERFAMTAQRGVRAAFELTWQELGKSASRTKELRNPVDWLKKQFHKQATNVYQVALLLGLFAPNDIPWKLVELATQSLKWSEQEVIEARKQLYKRHIIQLTSKSSYKIHPLIREFLKEKLEESIWSKKLKTTFTALMSAIGRTIHNYDQSRQQYQELIPIVSHIEEVAINLVDFISNSDLVWSFTALGEFYRHGQLDYSKAEFWYKLCLIVTQERLGKHSNVADSFHNLGLLYQEQGRYKEAESCHLQALVIYRELLGDEHSLSSSSLKHLANIYERQGNIDELKNIYSYAEKIKSKLLKRNDLEAAEGLTSLAELFFTEKKYQKAEPLLIQALTIRRKLLGENNSLVAASIANLATVYALQGRDFDAEPLWWEALEIWKSNPESNLSDMAACLTNLASYKKSEGHSNAVTLYLETLDFERKIFNGKHPKIAKTLQDLGEIYFEQNRYNETEPLWIEALQIRQEVFGESHPFVATSLSNLASLYICQKRYEDAENFFQNAVKIWENCIQENISGEFLSEYVACLVNMVEWYKVIGQDQKAESYHKQAIQFLRESSINKSVDVAESLNKLANLYDSQGRYDQAEFLYKEALEAAKSFLEENDPEITVFLNNLGISYYRQKKYKEAEYLYRQALAINEKAFGLEHEDVGLSYHNLSAIYDELGIADQAVALCQQAQAIWEKTIGQDAPLYARSLHRLAGIYACQGRLDDANLLYERALIVREKRLGLDHPDTVSTRQNLEKLRNS